MQLSFNDLMEVAAEVEKLTVMRVINKLSLNNP
jgi:hypothetical protein